MSRPRGNATSKVHREFRREAVVEALRESPTLTNKDLANHTGVSLATIERDLAALREQFQSGTAKDYAALQEHYLATLDRIEAALLDGMPTAVHAQLLDIQKERAKILGLYAPQRHLTAHVDASDPEERRLFLEWRKAKSGLSESQVEEVYRFAASLPRHIEHFRDLPGPPPMTAKPLALPELTTEEDE